MRPLLLLVSFIIGLSYGKPGGSYSYPSPTPSASPALLPSLGVPSPLFNLQAPTASVAPQVFLPSPAPPIAGLAAPPVAPSLLVENVVGAGQYGPALVNIGAQPLGLQIIGLQSFGGQAGFQSLDSQSGLQSQGSLQGFQSLGGQSGFQSLGGQSGFQSLEGQSGLQSLGSQSGFQSLDSQTGFQSLGSQTGFQSLGDQSGFQSGTQSFNLGQSSGLSQPSAGSPLQNQGLDLGQAGFSFGGPLLGAGSPQLSFASSQLPATPSPNLNVPSAGPTIAIPRPGLQRPVFQRSRDVVVQKHVYVHVAPEEPEDRSLPRQIVIPAPRKHYKIIFIKAPSPPPPKVAVLPPPVLDEERTLIYVLVKKPEGEPEIKIETPPPTQPAKPEVYFIKYNVGKEGISGGGPILPNDPVPEEGDSGGDLPNVEDVSRGNDPTIPTVRIGGPGLHTKVDTNVETNVDLNLNKASLDGGSALSLAVTGTPQDGTLHVSSTPPTKFETPEEE